MQITRGGICMKKRLGFAPIALLAMSVIALSGCDQVFGPTIELTDEAITVEKLIDFKDGPNPDVLFESDGWSNGDVFNVVWKKSNVHYENDLLRLAIKEEKATAYLNEKEVEFNYTAGEVRTQNYYGYGDYEVSMKPSKNPGTASTFFTCTGPYDTKFLLDENGDYVLDENNQRVTVNNAHDEIDIEFLGKDTTKVQFNFFVDGVGGNEYMYDLGFDAAEEFHEYGYRWEEDSITWFVDNVPVYKVTSDASVKTGKNVAYKAKLPSTPGRILSNYWCGTWNAAGWMGTYNGNTKDDGTTYQWFATSAVGAPLNPVETPDVPTTDTIDWSKVDEITQNFTGNPEYTIENNGTDTRITYTEVGGSSYINCEMDVTEEASNNNYVYLKVKNNTATPNRLRVNMVDMELVSAGAQNMALNESATFNGETAYTDLVWGGSFFDLGANQEAELVIKYGAGVEKLQLMPDSSKNDSSVNAGDLTIEAIKFAALGEVGGSTGGDDPVVPPTGDAAALSFWGGTGYTIDPAGAATTSVHVLYSGTGNTYQPMGADIASLAAGNNTFAITITNNGAADSKVRVDIQGSTKVGNTDCCNVSAVGGDVWTDLEWGGSTLTVAAGSTVDLVITYDGEGDHGAVTNLLVFVDSARGDSNTYSSDITLSNIIFANL